MAKGSLDFVYRVSNNSVVVSGWCFAADSTTPLSWLVSGSDWRSRVLGATRIRRPDVVQALDCSDTESPDCGFLAVLEDVPADLDRLTASILDLSFECEIIDLRALSFASAWDRLLNLTNWGFTPAERAEGLLKHQGLGRAILSLIAGTDHSWIQKQIKQLNESRSSVCQDQRLRLLLCCTHDPELLRLQLLGFFEALAACANSFDLILIPHPGWRMFAAEEWDRLENLLAVTGECNLFMLPLEAGDQSADAVINEQLDFRCTDSVVVLGSALLPASSSALYQLQSVLREEVKSQDLNAVWGQHDANLSLPLLLGDGGCCLIHPNALGCALETASKDVWSCFQEWSCLEPQPAPEVVKGLQFWRHTVRSFVAESMMASSDGS